MRKNLSEVRESLQLYLIYRKILEKWLSLSLIRERLSYPIYAIRVIISLPSIPGFYKNKKNMWDSERCVYISWKSLISEVTRRLEYIKKFRQRHQQRLRRREHWTAALQTLIKTVKKTLASEYRRFELQAHSLNDIILNHKPPFMHTVQL